MKKRGPNVNIHKLNRRKRFFALKLQKIMKTKVTMARTDDTIPNGPIESESDNITFYSRIFIRLIFMHPENRNIFKP